MAMKNPFMKNDMYLGIIGLHMCRLYDYQIVCQNVKASSFGIWRNYNNDKKLTYILSLVFITMTKNWYIYFAEIRCLLRYVVQSYLHHYFNHILHWKKQTICETTHYLSNDSNVFFLCSPNHLLSIGTHIFFPCVNNSRMNSASKF